MISAAEMIVGEIHHIMAVSIGWHDDVDVAREEIERAIQRVDAGNGVLVLTDMFGGTPTNIAASFLGQVPVEIVTGVNLPMVIKVATQEKDEPLMELARRVAALEILLDTPRIKELIKKGEVDTLKEAMLQGAQEGCQTFDTALFDLYTEDKISLDQALSNADSVNNLRLKIKVSEAKEAASEGKTDSGGLRLEGIQPARRFGRT